MCFVVSVVFRLNEQPIMRRYQNRSELRLVVLHNVRPAAAPKSFNQPLTFNMSSVTDMWGMFGVLSRITACAVNGVTFSYTAAALLANTPNNLNVISPPDCPSPAFETLEQGVATLDQPLILDQSVQVVVLPSGKTPFEVEEPLEVPAGRNLTIVSSRNGDTRVKVNMTEDLKVNGALQQR